MSDTQPTKQQALSALRSTLMELSWRSLIVLLPRRRRNVGQEMDFEG